MLFKGNLAENVLTGTDKIEWVKILGQSGTADRPSGLVLQANAAGVMTDYYFWVDQSANLRMHTSKPTDEDANGSVISGVSYAGASKALDNLASVAIATDLNLTDSVAVTFGASQDYNIEYDGSDLAIDPAAANDRILIGGTTVSDLQLTGAASELTWDGSDDTLTVMDSGILAFGDSDDFTVTCDGTTLDFDAAAANALINFGSTVATDVTFHGTEAGTDLTWDSSVNTLSLLDDAKLAFGDIDDLYLTFASAGTLSLLQTVAGTGSFIFGVDDHGVDVTFFGDTSGDYAKWDASANTLIFEDAPISVVGANTDYQLGISTDALLLDEVNDHANGNLIIGASGTNGLDVTFQGASSGDHVKFVATGTWTYTDVPVTLTGADSSGTLLTVTGIDTTGNTDTVTIAHSGTGAGLKITCSETDSQGLELLACANQTTWLGVVDGATNNWIGANDVGMLHLKGDLALAHAGASLLQVVHATTQPITAAEGHLARFISTGTAQTNAYGVEIAVSTTQGALHVSSGHALFAEYVRADEFRYTVTTRTATNTGATTGTILAGEGFLQIDTTTADDADIVILPAAIAGTVLWIYNSDGTYDFELTTAGTDVINGGSAGASTVGEDVLVRLVCVADGFWIGNQYAADGTESKLDASA